MPSKINSNELQDRLDELKLKIKSGDISIDKRPSVRKEILELEAMLRTFQSDANAARTQGFKNARKKIKICEEYNQAKENLKASSRCNICRRPIDICNC